MLAHIIPIRRCNLACAYCNEYDDVSKPVPTRRDVSPHRQAGAHWARRSSPSAAASRCCIRELDEIIRRIRKHGMIAGMITNGYLLDAGAHPAAERAGLEQLQISIDNVQPDEVSKKSLKVLDKKLQLLPSTPNFT